MLQNLLEIRTHHKTVCRRQHWATACMARNLLHVLRAMFPVSERLVFLREDVQLLLARLSDFKPLLFLSEGEGVQKSNPQELKKKLIPYAAIYINDRLYTNLENVSSGVLLRTSAV